MICNRLRALPVPRKLVLRSMQRFRTLGRPGTCAVFGSAPVASFVHSNGSLAGLRFLVCALCAKEWHLMRIKCAGRASAGGIACFEIDGARGLVKAEIRDRCRTYI
jgi:FdhE protein